MVSEVNAAVEALYHKAIDRIRRRTRFKEKLDSYASGLGTPVQDPDYSTCAQGCLGGHLLLHHQALQFLRAGEQDIVFEMNVLVQVPLELVH